MPQDPQQYPKTDVGTNQEEQIWRDHYMINYHINSHKMRVLKGITDIIDAHREEWDFCEALDDGIVWNVDTVAEGEGDPSYTCMNAVNGVLQLVNDDADNDLIEVTRLCECWKLVDCYPLYCEARLYIDNVLLSNFWFGLVTGNSFFTQPDDFVVFENDGVDANLEITNRVNGAGNETLTGIVMAAATWYRLGIHWDGAGTIRWFVFQDGDLPQTCLATGLITTSIVQDEELAIGFGIRNEGAAAREMRIDYVKISQMRVIE